MHVNVLETAIRQEEHAIRRLETAHVLRLISVHLVLLQNTFAQTTVRSEFAFLCFLFWEIV